MHQTRELPSGLLRVDQLDEPSPRLGDLAFATGHRSRRRDTTTQRGRNETSVTLITAHRSFEKESPIKTLGDPRDLSENKVTDVGLL